MQLIFATHNQNKFLEVKALLPKQYTLLSLNDIDCHDEIVETGTTLTENAKIKADFITHNYGLDCFADDTGLEVDALHGAPGVYSARYAGPQNNANDNMNRLLDELKGVNNRAAQFITVIALNIDGHN
ncbi:MAG: non-canonical purine NTP pyrophosphatase, partial [Flavobacteriaceae bacterium]